ncbi:MAG: hypothetical protein JSV62_04805 [Promethearchaeota archaeon]|nr:MAG: hypothetical protein JSV62_04805 [Candidatus Lokiarchaeota archaeon]
MSETGLKKENLELEANTDSIDKLNKGDGNLYKEYETLKEKNYQLEHENNLLKEVILENEKNNFQSSLREGDPLKSIVKYPKIGKSFYLQIFLGIFVIILSLGFHLLYLSVTSCLMYNEGKSFCWIANWLGFNIHASLFLDIVLYSLIAVQIILILIIVRNKIHEIK